LRRDEEDSRLDQVAHRNIRTSTSQNWTGLLPSQEALSERQPVLAIHLKWQTAGVAADGKRFVSLHFADFSEGRAMLETILRANNAKSKIRARVEHVFAEQKDRMGLFIRTIGIARATTKIGMSNLVYNIKRLIFLRKIAIA
jgi:hypothetical protein